MSQDENERQVKKLRKLLRQIERLELVDRDLNEEELLKISKKENIRWGLLNLLRHISESKSDSPNDEAQEPQLIGSTSEISDSSTVKDTSADSILDDDDSLSEERGASELPISSSKIDESTEMKRKSDSSSDLLGSATEKIYVLEKEPQPDDAPATPWMDHKFISYELIGHSDIIYDVATNGQYVVSCSRDTTIKVWDVSDGSEKLNLGSHTGSVSCIKLINNVQSQVLKKLISEDTHTIIISGSQDCTVKFWSIRTGTLLKSIYTFNPVTAIDYYEAEDILIIGTGGGKVELWNLEDQNALQSLKSNAESITSIIIDGNRVCIGSNDGVIKIFTISQGSINLIYESETMKTEDGITFSPRPIKSMLFIDDLIYFGDDGMNIKVLDWKKGIVKKLANHRAGLGSTDALFHHDKFIYSSGYDLDNAASYINVRGSDNMYVGTFDDDDTSKILSVAVACHTKKDLVIVTGGWELKMWKQIDNVDEDQQELIFSMNYFKDYKETPEHSDVDTDEEIGPEDIDFSVDSHHSQIIKQDVSNSSSWYSYCTIL